MLKRLWNYMLLRSRALLSIQGDRRVIARGIAVGIAMNFLPTIGLGLPVVYWAAASIRGHKTAAVISTMSIKCLFPLLYILNYIIGELILERHFVFTLDWHMAVKAGASFVLGSIVNFIISYIASYYFFLKTFKRKQEKTAES